MKTIKQFRTQLSVRNEELLKINLQNTLDRYIKTELSYKLADYLRDNDVIEFSELESYLEDSKVYRASLNVEVDVKDDNYKESSSSLNKGMIFRHFKHELDPVNAIKYIYKIIGIATDCNSESQVVVYESVYNRELYTRNICEFLSRVDKDKYPSVKQEYRFERLEGGIHEI